MTTASAVANYLGEPDVTAAHLLHAIAILSEQMELDDLGRPVSPLVPRGGERGAEPSVRELAQRWWMLLGGDIAATLNEEQLHELKREAEALLREHAERGH